VSGGIVPRILNFGVGWWWVVNFTPRSLYPGERAPCTYGAGGWVGLRDGLDAVAKRSSSLPGI